VHINRLRKVGNSKVISLPRDLERLGFVEGAQIAIQELPNGEVRLIPVDRLAVMVRSYGRRAVARNRAALNTLAADDGER
jgi:antitoxin component of MazEF toxin-antitoxin module